VTIIVELLNREVSEHTTVTRLPYAKDLKDAVDKYITTGQGVVVLHQSLYDYRYDTKLSDYHKVDSISIAGHVVASEVRGEKVFVTIELNDSVSTEKRYLCFYRAPMQSAPSMVDHTLMLTNLFSIDLITVLDKEVEEYHLNPPSFEIV
jgi:hypothetical protein